METDEAALEEYKSSLKKVERSIADLESSYLDPKTTVGFVLRGWPEGELKVKSENNDFEGGRFRTSCSGVSLRSKPEGSYQGHSELYR